MSRPLIRIAPLIVTVAAALAFTGPARATPTDVRVQTVEVSPTFSEVTINWDTIAWDSSAIFRWMEWAIFDRTTLTLREYEIGMNCCHDYGETETRFSIDWNRAYVFTVRACDIPNNGSNVVLCSPYESGTFQTYLPPAPPTQAPPPGTAIRWSSAAIQASRALFDTRDATTLAKVSKATYADPARAVGVYVDRAGQTEVLVGS